MLSYWEHKIVIVTLPTMILTLVAAQAWGTNQVSFTLELGGDNHAAQVKADTYVTFTPGNPADGQYFPPGTPEITWDVKIEASGTHQVGGTPYNIKGVANFVFNLELHEGTADGPLVTTAPFYSSIHDGQDDCACCENGFCESCLSAAAFSLSFKVCGTGLDPARVIDPCYNSCPGGFPIPPQGGPNLGVYCYPTNPGDGTLLGMRAGYQHWCKSCGETTYTTEGVGIPEASGGLGILPVCEGQIDTTFFPNGTYVLKLVPCPGNNVLRGDLDLGQDQDNFAIPADQAIGDTITFAVGHYPVPYLVSAFSRMDHAGTICDKPLPLDGIGCEPRVLDAFMDIYLNFNTPIFPHEGSFECGRGIIVRGATCIAVLASTDDTLHVIIADMQDCVTIICERSEIVNINGEPLEANMDNDVQFYVLLGDVGPDGVVNAIDLGIVKERLFQAVTNDNCGSDVNRDRIINAVDLGIVLDPGVLFTTATCPLVCLK